MNYSKISFEKWLEGKEKDATLYQLYILHAAVLSKLHGLST